MDSGKKDHRNTLEAIAMIEAFLVGIHMGGNPKIGVFPPKWMVKIVENPMNKWMIWGYHYFSETSI